MHVVETRKSALYSTLAWMGLLSTEERRIREIRQKNSDAYILLDLNYDDIERVGYYYPHVELDPKYFGFTEMWIGDHYLNPESLTVIQTHNVTYIVVDDKYDELLPVHCHINPSIVHRYSVVNPDGEEHVHTMLIDTTDPKYAQLSNLEHAIYYISQDKVCVPITEWLDDTTLRIQAPYRNDIDLFICGNLVNVVEAKAGVGVYLDRPHSNYCYHEITVDHDPTYPIDARFYPCVAVDKDCVLRVYNDNYHTILFPEVSRLILYPEFLEIEDPYNTTNRYLSELKPVDDIIGSNDSDQVIIDKFSRIVSSCFRLWKRYPIHCSEQSDFVICDNAQLREQAFVIKQVRLTDTSGERICSTVPFEAFRDLLFYDGTIFTDYIVRKTRLRDDGTLIEHPNGMDTYIIPTDYNPSKFTVVKFNTAEDTTIMNIGEYINPENIARLHFKLNRFYRNLMVIRTSFMDDIADDEYVRVMTTEPTTKDDVLWFELLVNAVPEMFETNPIDTINLFGLDPDKIPEDIKRGAYALELDPQDGPTNYSQLLMTYYKLTKAHKDYLVLQSGEGIDDPRIQVIHDLKVGHLRAEPELNELAVDDTVDPTYTEKKVEYGYKDHPEIQDGPHEPGDLYLQRNDPEIIPPGADNIHIDKISMGPNTPEPDEKTLWIEDKHALPDPDEYDAVSDTVQMTNSVDTVQDPKMSDYAIESIDGALTPEQEGDAQIEGLLDGIGVPAGDDTTDIPEDLLDGISDVVGNNRSVADIENPTIGDYALDDISLYNDDLGRMITMDEISAMPNDVKYAVAVRIITNDQEPANSSVGDLWIRYLSSANTELLNTIVFKLLLAKDVCHLDVQPDGTLALEGEGLPRTDETLAYGDHPEYVRPNEMLIESVAKDSEGNAVPNWAAVKGQAVRYIMSKRTPDDVNYGDVWFDMPAVTFQEVIKDVLSSLFSEIGKELPDGLFEDDGHDIHASMGIDYYAHDKGTEDLGDLFREKTDETLHRIFYGSEPDHSMLQEDDVWYEFLDDINNRVAYSDPNTMIVRVDERLILLQFENENFQAFAFDDIMVNFRGRLGVKYLSIIADLLNSGELSQEQVNIFYKRLVTFGDEIDLDLRRLYTGQSNIIVANKLDTTDLSVMYSTNIGRFRMDYSSPDMSNREREAAYRMVIDYSKRDFAFLHRRMLLFVNGKYIPTTDYEEDFAGKIQLKNFHEIIATVDIFYQIKDRHLMELKRTTYQYWQIPDISVSIQTPSQYDTMQYIAEYDYTMKGYYDVLMDEYIFSGKLMNILSYLEEHPEEAEEYRRDLIRKFHAISDTDISAMPFDRSRIVLDGNNNGDVPYQIGTTPI